MEIYGTLGPSCMDSDILEDMFHAGMTGIRLNLSHITIKDATDMIEMYHKAAKRAGKADAKLLIDLQGPEIRIGVLAASLNLVKGETINLGAEGIPVPDLIFPYLMDGQQILLDDGRILLTVTGDKKCVVERGGILTSRKSIAIAGCSIPAPTLTSQDRINLKVAKSYGVTGIMQPFVRDKEDLKNVRQAMKETGCENLSLLAKVENRNGVEHLHDFFEYADEIVIARGDLGNAMPLWELPGIQKRISALCNENSIPFMVVTQMLASMETRSVPTRAEVSDIYNAVLDGASSVMVTGETAAGAYPVEVIRYLANTAAEALKDRKERICNRYGF